MKTYALPKSGKTATHHEYSWGDLVEIHTGIEANAIVRRFNKGSWIVSKRGVVLLTTKRLHHALARLDIEESNR